MSKSGAAPERFGFDRVFAPDGTVLRDPVRANRLLTEAEVEARVEAAVAEALNAEAVRAEEAQAEALRAIAGRMQAILARLDQESAALRADAARLAVVSARKIAGAALERWGDEAIAACATEALADLRGEPRLTVRVAPDLADAVADKLAAEADRMGFEGAVVVRADAETPAGDCVLDWRAGAVERTAEEIAARVEAAVESWLAGPDETDAADAAAPGGEAA